MNKVAYDIRVYFAFAGKHFFLSIYVECVGLLTPRASLRSSSLGQVANGAPSLRKQVATAIFPPDLRNQVWMGCAKEERANETLWDVLD